MPSLDDIVLVSEDDFASTYSRQSSLKKAVKRLEATGITFPIKYNSEFFRQLNALAAMVYFKGSLTIASKDNGFVEYAPAYDVKLFVTDKLGHEWVKGKISPYFSVSAESTSVSVGNTSVSNLIRPLAKILYCLEIPTNGQHLTAGSLPSFVTDLALTLPRFSEADEAVARTLLLDFYEVFLRVKTTFANDFYWRFFLPIKENIDAATLFRDNLAMVLGAAIPEVQLHRLGVPRPRTRDPSVSAIDYYDSILGIKREGVKTIIARYADTLCLAPLLASRPRLQEFHLVANGPAE